MSNKSSLIDEDIAWIVRRLPKCVVDLLMKTDVFLAGGFIRSCITNDTVADVDLFVNSEAFAKNLASELAAQRGVKVYETANALTVKVGDLPVQFIHRWTFETPEACVESFDFTIACAAIWYDRVAKSWRSVCDGRYYSDLAARRLVYRSPIRNEEAGGSLLRVLKFYQRGFRITLPSLGAVIARLANGVRFDEVPAHLNYRAREQWFGRLFTSLLVEVDPNAILGPGFVANHDVAQTPTGDA